MTCLSSFALKKGPIDLLAAIVVPRELDALFDGFTVLDARRVGEAFEERLALLGAATRHAETFRETPRSFTAHSWVPLLRYPSTILPPMAEPVLPSGWMKTAGVDGKPLYINKETGQTSWRPPVGSGKPGAKPQVNLPFSAPAAIFHKGKGSCSFPNSYIDRLYFPLSALSPGTIPADNLCRAPRLCPAGSTDQRNRA